MREIWVTELIIAFFLVLFFLRPLVKRLWPLDGLVWLPVLAMGLTIAVFFAYGFRPECIPLLIFEFLLNLVNIPALISSTASRPNDDYHDRSPIFTFAAFVLLGGVIFVMFFFSPQMAPELLSENVEIRDEGRGREYFLRIYRQPQAAPGPAGIQPLLFLIPPEAGSITAVDRVCAALRDRGFTVLSYSRRGFDFPAADGKGGLHLVSPGKMLAYWRAFRAGTALKKANDQGKILETERQRDIEFLLPRIPALAGGGPAGEAPLFVAGYGAGGSALILLAGDAGFSLRYPGVRGIIALESRLWSVYRYDPPVFPPIPAGTPWYARLRADLARRLDGLKTRRISGIGSLPRPGLPLLCVVSDLAESGTVKGKGAGADKPYQALLAALRSSPGPTALAAFKGSGPLDYSDYPLSYPVYSFLFQGQARGAEKSLDPVGDTAGIICNFAVKLLEQDALPSELLIIPQRQNITAGFSLETKNLPRF